MAFARSRPKPAGRRPAWGKIALGILALAGLASAWRWTPLAEFLTRENISAWARAVRETPWAPFALVLAYTPAALLLFPRQILTLVAVIAFGPRLGLTCSSAGVLVAALATYYAGRLLRRDTVLRLAGGKLDEVSAVLRKHGVLAVFASNMMPVPPFAVQGIIAGAIRIQPWKYTLGSILGMAPGLLAATLFARELRAALEDPSKISWWLIGGVLAGFAAFVFLVRRWLGKRMGPA